MDLITAEITDFVNRVRLGFVATVCADGTPNLSPKGTTIALDDHHIAFADIHSPGTIKNLLLNPSVEVNVVDVFNRKGYRFKGKGLVLTEGEMYESVLAIYGETAAKYTIHHIVVIRVEEVHPVVSPAYDSETEDEITNRWIQYWDSVHPKK